MTTLLLTFVVVIGVYALVMFILPKSLVGESNTYTQRSLSRIFKETAEDESRKTGDISIVKEQSDYSSPFGRLLLALPGMQSGYELLLKSGFGAQAPGIALGALLLSVALSLAAVKAGLGLLGFFGAYAAVFFVFRWYFKNRIRKRNDAFINQFPDALDMIVRSVRSGFPVNTALRMIAENTEPPVSTEFKQVVDEIAFGRSLSDALQRLANRIDEADIQFFVVVLNVQQEAGGNLAEVIGNLSNIIRKRKQLRLKIKAMTSEARATGWVLGAIPIVLFLIIWKISPQHMEPLFNTTAGNICLATAIGLVLTAGVIVRQMVRIDI